MVSVEFPTWVLVKAALFEGSLIVCVVCGWDIDGDPTISSMYEPVTVEKKVYGEAPIGRFVVDL